VTDEITWTKRGVTYYRYRTEWERRTLIANGFVKSDKGDDVMESSKEGAEYCARQIKHGGNG